MKKRSLVKDIRNRFIRWYYRRHSHFLSTTEPERIVQIGERRLLRAFHRAAEMVPAYGKILMEKGIDHREINTIRSFKENVPLLDKSIVFQDHEIKDFCVGGHLDDVCSFHSSSGYSGDFSFGVETWENRERLALGLEFLLDNAFHIYDRKTLIINCLSMGVKVPTRRVPVAETSVRADVVHALIEKLAKDFQQFVILGEALFLKRVFEEGLEKGIQWDDLIIHVVTGGEFIAENFRLYLGHLLGIDFEDPDRGTIVVNMGLSELSLSIFLENYKTARLRRMALEDPDLLYALFGVDNGACPLLMQYFPQSTFIESIPGQTNRPELVVSMLDPHNKIPLIRYRTGDIVQAVEYREIEKTVKDFGHENLMPEFKLPFAIVWGKDSGIFSDGDITVTPNEVKEALYRDFDIARHITGNFHLSRQDGELLLMLQLRKDHESSSELMEERVSAYLIDQAKTGIRVKAVKYYEMPYGLEQDFERKIKYV